MSRLFSRLGLALACLVASVAGAQAQPATDRQAGPVAAATERARTAMMSNPAEAEALARSAERFVPAIADPRARLLALAGLRSIRGEAYLRLGRSDRADALIGETLRLIEPVAGPVKVRGDLLVSQGALRSDAGDAAGALESYQRAHEIFRLLGERRSQSLTLQMIASLYYAGNDGNRAEQYYRQAAEVYDEDPALALALHNNRGNVLLTLERYREAETEFAAALKIARARGDRLLEARVLLNLARNEVEAEQLDVAEATLQRGFALATGDEALTLRRQLLATSARVASERGDLSRARRLITTSFAGIDTRQTTQSFAYAHSVAHLIFSATGDSRRALDHLQALKRLDDEAAKVATTTGAALMAARFDSANQELRIEKLRTEQARRTAEYQRNLFVSIGGATLVVIALLSISLVMIRRSRNRVRDANVVLNETNAALEKALKAKTEFLATTSHEIRTPLNGILGMTQVMLSDARIDAETRDRIGIVHGAGMTMRSLVDDILDLAKMETGNLTVEAAPMDLCATLRDVTRMWQEQARAKGLEFQLQLSHAPQWIVSDAGRLRQIVFNLLSNAIKFTEAGSVGLRATEEGEGDARRLRLAIADSGIGIPEDKREEIFESFRQVDAGTTRRFGGTGLGLAICRNLAHALGGEISVVSTPGEGSTFTVDLPLVPASAPGAADPAQPAANGRLLVLDRNPIARSMLKTLLAPRLASLRFAATPAEAIAALAAEGVDALLADEATLKAAGDPFAALRDVKNAGGAARLLVAWAQPDAATRAALAAADAAQVLEKPVSGAALIEAVVGEAAENSGSRPQPPLVSRAA